MNRERITIDDAIKRARWAVSLPYAIVFLLSIIITGIILIVLFSPVVAFIFSVPISTIISSLYRNNAIANWKLWAYPKVTDINALKEDALKLGVLEKPTNITAKIAFSSKWKEAEIERMELEANNKPPEEILEDDTKLGDSYVVYAIQPIFLPFIIALGTGFIFLMIHTQPDGIEKKIASIIALILGGFIAIHFFIRLVQKRNIALLFSQDGIYVHTERKKLYAWNMILDIELRQISKTVIPVLITTEGETTLYSVNISNQRLLHIYRIYKNRHLKSKE